VGWSLLVWPAALWKLCLLKACLFMAYLSMKREAAWGEVGFSILLGSAWWRSGGVGASRAGGGDLGVCAAQEGEAALPALVFGAPDAREACCASSAPTRATRSRYLPALELFASLTLAAAPDAAAARSEIRAAAVACLALLATSRSSCGESTRATPRTGLGALIRFCGRARACRHRRNPGAAGTGSACCTSTFPKTAFIGLRRMKARRRARPQPGSSTACCRWMGRRRLPPARAGRLSTIRRPRRDPMALRWRL